MVLNINADRLTAIDKARANFAVEDSCLGKWDHRVGSIIRVRNRETRDFLFQQATYAGEGSDRELVAWKYVSPQGGTLTVFND